MLHPDAAIRIARDRVVRADIGEDRDIGIGARDARGDVADDLELAGIDGAREDPWTSVVMLS